nr:reverse transcriptase domain-containing protein [Tanacetum cinerariifolium]
MPLFIWKKLSLPKLTPTRMTLKLSNRSVAYSVGVAKDVFVKVGKFHFSADFVVVDYDVDPRETFLEDGTSINRYVACKEYAQKVLGVLDSLTSGNPTPSDLIIASSSPSFTPFEGGDFILEEIETFLHPSLNLPLMKNEDLKQVDVTMTKPLIEEPLKLELKDLRPHLEYAFLEGTDKLLVIISKELKDEEKAVLLKDDFKPAVQHQRRVNPKIHEVVKKEIIKLLDARLIHPISDSPWETMEVFMDDFSVFGDSFSSCLSHLDKMLKQCEDTNLVLNWEKCHSMVKEGVVLGHKISKSGIEVNRAKVNVIAKVPHPSSVKGVRSFLGHIGFYRRFIQDFSKIARPMTHHFEKETPLYFSKECIEAFNSLKKMLTEALILVASDWDLSFEIMCDASNFTIEFDVVIRDKKGAKNLAVGHLSRLENPHQVDLENKEINETFPLETLGMISSHSDSSTLWSSDIANYHAMNFIVKGISS